MRFPSAQYAFPAGTDDTLDQSQIIRAFDTFDAVGQMSGSVIRKHILLPFRIHSDYAADANSYVGFEAVARCSGIEPTMIFPVSSSRQK